MTTRQPRLSLEQINIRREVDYIVGCAAEHDARIVVFGPLVSFSTESGDAWLLDPSEQLALCLARAGDPQAVDVIESTGQFAIDWQMTYQIDGNRFIVTDRNGQSRTIVGYPIRQIARAIQPEPAQQASEPRPQLPGRNEPCWCGSGKKYKHCHMLADQSGDESR